MTLRLSVVNKIYPSGHMMQNKITFKNSVFVQCNVCACAVSALILLPVVNLSLEMDSAPSISYMTETF